ncbi:MAG: hypothetical protein HWD86_02505 [Kangiellaceae bacterium]|nr:hypothetical protein [Kangiellaceae bacterium]
MIEKLLSLQPAGYVSKPRSEQKLKVTALNQNTWKAIFPQNIQICSLFLQELDSTIADEATTPCKLLIELNGVDGFTENSKRHLVSKAHIQHYQAIAFVKKTTGDMSVLENHYLQQFLQFTQIPEHYSKQFFVDEKKALNWLEQQH